MATITYVESLFSYILTIIMSTPHPQEKGKNTPSPQN